MTLLWAWSLVLLLLLPALVAAYVWILRRRKRPAMRYSSLSLVAEALSGGSRVRRHLPFALFVLALGALVLSLARPAAVVAVPAGRTSVLIVIDVSRSMCASDILPSRLIAAEEAAAEFIERQGPTTQIGIVAFAGFAELVQPPTTDVEVLLDAIRSLTTGRRTAVGGGILAAIDAIAEIDPDVAPAQTGSASDEPPPEPVSPGAYVPDIIVVLTDGASNTGPSPVEAAQQAADRGIRVYTIGFGTSAGGQFDPACAPQYIGREPWTGPGGGGGSGGFRRGIDEETLIQVAEVSGGQYYPAESAGELHEVFRNLPTHLLLKHEVMELSVVFAGLGALLTVLAIGLSQAWRPLP